MRDDKEARLLRRIGMLETSLRLFGESWRKCKAERDALAERVKDLEAKLLARDTAQGRA